MPDDSDKSPAATGPPVHFQGCTEKTPPPGEHLVIPRCVKPLSLVTVTDGALRPALEPGQQVFVQKFHPHGVGYMEQRFALRYKGRIIVRHTQAALPPYRLWGNQDGYEIMLPLPENWERPDDWRQTGVIHPDCTVLGPLLKARGEKKPWPHCHYLATAGWSN